jgi:hypothetical protein
MEPTDGKDAEDNQISLLPKTTMLMKLRMKVMLNRTIQPMKTNAIFARNNFLTKMRCGIT